MYDIIGDIHGHADALEQLLQKLDYDKSKGYYSHPERKVIFVGDYIDRGPKIKETLEMVRAMADNQAAIALMGNHEFNAILYNTIGTDGNYLREDSDRNVSQHSKTVEQFRGDVAAYNSYIKWFKSLPLFYEEENLRAVHACWDEIYIQFLRDNLINHRLTDEILLQQYNKNNRLTEAIEVTLKGKELPMPEGLTFFDKDGHARRALRVKWWLSPKQITYRQYSVSTYDTLTDDIVPEALVSKTSHTLLLKNLFSLGITGCLVAPQQASTGEMFVVWTIAWPRQANWWLTVGKASSPSILLTYIMCSPSES